MLKLEDVEQVLGVPLHGALVATEELLELVAAEEAQRPHWQNPAADAVPGSGFRV